MATYTLSQYMDKDALAAVLQQDNKAKLRTLRSNVPFNFLNYLVWDIKPNIYTMISQGDNNPVAARVTTWDVAANTHTPSDLSETTLEKFPIAAKRVLTEKQALELSNALQRSANPASVILGQMFDDVNLTKISIWERFEFYFLQLLSQGKIVLDATSNNSGLATTIDYEISADNKHDASIIWATSATADPIEDIKGVVEDANDRGLYPNTIFMLPSQFRAMVACSKFIAKVFTTLTPGATAQLIGVDQVNAVFTAAGLPQIRIIQDASFVYNNLGARTKVSAWNTDYVVLGIDGNMGTVAVATPPTDLLAESSNPIWGVDGNGILTSIKSDKDPIAIETQSRVYGMLNMPQIYDFQYLKIANI